MPDGSAAANVAINVRFGFKSKTYLALIKVINEKMIFFIIVRI